MRRAWAPLLAVALAVVPRIAAGDELGATLSQPLSEISHSVELRIEDDVAVYVVRRTFANTGARADEAQLDIDLPMGAAVTGLRIRARDRWYDAELMEAGEAAEKYRELTSLGAWEPKDPALLQWVWADRMHLQVFPVFPGSTSTVEYTLTAPLQYREGRYVASYPRAVDFDGEALALATPVLTIDPGHGDATTKVVVDGQPVAPQTPVVLAPPTPPKWIGEGEADLGSGHAWSQLPVDQEGSVATASLHLEIDHTYRGDLQASLVTPAGVHVALPGFEGSDNDIRETFELPLPEGTEAQGTWHLHVADSMGLDVGTIEAWSLELHAPEAEPSAPAFRKRSATDVPVFIPDAPEDGRTEGLALIEVEPRSIDTMLSRYGRVEVEPELHFLRLELEAAPQLEPLPKNASVVFVVDASRSARSVTEQLALARGYMKHVPDAEAEVVLFRRFAERITDDFLPADELWPTIDRAQADGRLDLGNGSAMEEGLRLAGRALRGRRGPKRIVVLTDARLRSRFTIDDGHAGMAASPRGTIAHVVVPEEDGWQTRLARDDRHELAPIPAETGGVLFGLHEDGTDDKALERVALALVRPIAIDDFAIDGIDLTLAPEVPEVFAEGTSYGFMVEASTSPRRVVVSGKIWNRDFRRVVRSSRSFGDATAAFVFSEDEHHELTPEQMMTVAMRGRAVSPVTSYLATEPGVRPSTLGLEGRGRGGGGSGEGTFGLGGMGLIGKGGGGRPPSFTLAELMEPGVEACVEQHHPAEGWSVELEVETTSLEIVDVLATTGSSAMTKCLVEAAWAVELSWNFQAERKTHSLSLP